MNTSLSGRLLAVATIALLLFLGLTGLALDRAFQNRTKVSYQNQLQGHVYGLLAAMDVDVEGILRVPKSLPEPRFARPDSGLYGEVRDNSGKAVWRSASTMGRPLPGIDPPAVGETQFSQQSWGGVGTVFMFQHGVAWEIDSGVKPYVIRVAQSLDSYYDEVRAFRRTILLWLAGLGVLLLVLQALLLRWTLSPLRQVVTEVSAVERGERLRLSENYPREIRILGDNLNAFLASEQRQRERYRNALADLAHSLKTPLALIGTSANSGSGKAPESSEVQRHVERMREIIDYQLQRAATAGGGTMLASPVPLLEQVTKITAALEKVYKDKSIHYQMDVESGAVFFGDAGDLYEMLGNLLDNASKWCVGQVKVSAHILTGGRVRRPGLRVTVEDDGPGVETHMRQKVLQRGVRIDARKEGQGIGLAMTQEIVTGYGGTLAVGMSRLGGAKITLSLPGR